MIRFIFLAIALCLSGCATEALTFEELESTSFGSCTKDILESTILVLGNAKSTRPLCEGKERRTPSTQK